jgi:NTP pyrophosphatase (non-canonical NTP hydrolase)
MDKQSLTLKQWAEVAYHNASAKGFHDDDEKLQMREKLGAWCMNLHSEVSELWEAFRAGKAFADCDKAEKMRELGLPVLTCIEEELADIVIRVFDTAEALGIDIEKAVSVKHEYNTTRSIRHGGKLA